MRWRAQIFSIMMMAVAGPALGAATESAPKEAKGDESAGFSELPGSAVPGSEEILDSVRERLVARTKREITRRAALKEEAERQRRIRQGLRDAGIDLEYLPVPEAIKELERMTPAQVREDNAEPDTRSDRLYSAIETSKGDAADLGVERPEDREVLLRVICNEKGSDLDGQTLDRLGMDANEARQLSARICP
jgi:hypothetical protein